MTAPGRRVSWQVGVTGVEMVATGNRRGVGATNHCLHGADASIEELVDWRPYDYFTFRNTIPTPNGPIRMLETTEFDPPGRHSSRREARWNKARRPCTRLCERGSRRDQAGG